MVSTTAVVTRVSSAAADYRDAMPVGAGDDGALLLAARRGEADAWDALVERFAGRVWAVIRAHGMRRADADDVFQVTWFQLVTHLDTIREPDRVGAWLATTARHECLRLLRAAGRLVPTAGENQELEPAAWTGPPVEAGVLAAERDVTLWEGLAQLSAKCQQLIRVLMADPEPSYEEVSVALAMPIGSIGPTRRRCLDGLRHKLATITGDETAMP